ncbi:glycosyltransferase family 2 protein [Methylophaga sulfidovorans]|uniref:Glycosyltransferase 2-like domain-containing protein n=1 Tax=Methylophaga sulfidovorans TaxID=45496 RepID=A0A1I3XMZ9_9GAMM|nr:glycosyltransferase family 2 protein [Methylophaga sulfidovorans]SFK20885.1 hypothetical protein SAMN04488079_106160 [Methylophaga sulfidovorans]
MESNLETFRLAVSIVNYKSSQLVCNLLPTLISQLDLDTDRIIIIDNKSPDNSVSEIQSLIDRSNWQEFVKLIPAEVNGGFSYGNNLAIGHAIESYGKKPQYVWLVNPDTQMKTNALDALLMFMDSNSQAGILGSRLEAPNGQPQCSAFRFHTIGSELLSALRLGILDKLFQSKLVSPSSIPLNSEQCDWVAGASMFIRYKAIDNIGMMDETYFLYFEETDFCLQAKRQGWECWYVPESRVVHYVGQSTGVVSGDVQRRRRPKYWFQSRQHYFKKNYGVIYTMLADLAWGLGFSLLKLRYLIQRKKGTDPEYMLRDFWRNSIFLSWLDRF